METLTYYENGAPDELTGVRLTVLKRGDTLVVIPDVTLPADFADAGDGLWRYTFAKPTDPPATYFVIVALTYSGGRTEAVRLFTPPPSKPTEVSVYASSQQQ